MAEDNRKDCFPKFFQDIPEGLTYYPSEEDMKNFAQFIERIEKICTTGICKVVPPVKFRFPNPEENLESKFSKMVKENVDIKVAEQ
jgi:hypothetical protein